MKKTLPHIPIIIINWNGYEDTCSCIKSLFDQDYEDFTIYLVDNNSANGEGERLRDNFTDNEKVEFFGANENLGFTRANNWMVKELLQEDYKYFALLNNDTEVEPNWLSNLVRSAMKEKAHIISSKLINYFNREVMDNAGHQMLNTGEIIPIGHGANVDDFQDIFENLGSCAAATLYDADMIRDIGFFDSFFSTGYEDAEFGVRAWLAGYKCLFEPQAIVYHKLGSSIKKIFNVDYALMIQCNIWYSYFKLMPWQVIVVSLPLILIKQLSIMLINIVFFRWLYIQVQWQAFKNSFFTNWSHIRKARRSNAGIRRLTWSKILNKQTFFIKYDIRRFWQVYIQGKKSAFDEYGL